MDKLPDGFSKSWFEQSARFSPILKSTLDKTRDFYGIAHTDHDELIEYNAFGDYIFSNRDNAKKYFDFLRTLSRTKDNDELFVFLLLSFLDDEEIKKKLEDLNELGPDGKPVSDPATLLYYMDINGHPIREAHGVQLDSPFHDLIETSITQPAREVHIGYTFLFSTFKTTESIVNFLFEVAKKETQPDRSGLPHIKYKKTNEIKTSTDKLSNVFFSPSAPTPLLEEINGQRQMIELKYEGKRSKKSISVFYDFTFNEDVLSRYGLSKKFDDFDFFVMSVSDNLLAAGNSVVSLTQFYYEMGGTGSPATAQLERCRESLLKGMSTIITIDDAQAQNAWKIKSETYHEIVSPVMPVQILNERFAANGNIANCYIKITGYSPFYRVADPLNHITAWNKDVLRLYTGRRTPRYYSVLRFLMQQIGWMINGSRSHKILYSSLYNYTADTTVRKQQLAKDMMYKLLDEVFIPTGYISGYKEDATADIGVVLLFRKKKLPSAKE